ncbi:hypothetical protein SELMODRAFT_404844 [Selaginella moellendorffii]|uniref:Uncharacterized protein n=1 Tax=Selaginella moellendorffii TaxID=88036 RepID=D8QXJ3_SELML|nr:hypothetical protein SELMODRAFT_404844 [Selaginella moellendorffii]
MAWEGYKSSPFLPQLLLAAGFLPCSRGHMTVSLRTIELIFGSADIRVSSRALLHGYLFYEPALWKFLCTTSSDFRGSAYGDSTVNSRHWKGWWMDVEGFQTFASAPERMTIKWYIIPKMEWLSSVVIQEDKESFLHSVLSSDGLVDMAAKVAKEVSRMDRDRMRCFMVTEIRWQSDECHWIWSDKQGFLSSRIPGQIPKLIILTSLLHLGVHEAGKEEEWKSATPSI